MDTNFPPYEVVFENDYLLIVNKIAAISVLPDKTKDKSLKDLLLEERKDKFLEAVHRLDRRTSGLVVFAKSQKSLSALSETFRCHQIEKTYWAVTEQSPQPQEGDLKNILVHDKRRNVTRAYPDDGTKQGDKVELHYKQIACSQRYFLLEVKPLTGKTHQIRAQLSAQKCPIRGDLKYGARRSTANGLIMLHARALSFEGPDYESISVVAQPPLSDNLWNAFDFKTE